MGDTDPTTEELRLDQLRREARERDSASSSGDPDARDQHSARARKAEYLRRKLEDRERAERDAG